MEKVMGNRGLVVVALLALASACAPKGGEAVSCQQGESHRCVCPAGGEGLQTCDASGARFSACVCADACASGAACVPMPDLHNLDMDAAGDALTKLGLRLPDPIDPNGFIVMETVNDPPVQVLGQQPPAGTPVKPGTVVVLTVTKPPDQESLGLPNNNFLVGGLPIDDDTSAQRYYDALDPGPFPTRGTLADWKAANGFGTPADAEASAIYVTHADLGFGRHMHMRRKDRRVAFYVDNYPTLDDDIAGTKFFATVAMEWSPGPRGRDTDPYFTQFYTFNKKGERITDPILDSHGRKLSPAVCLICHGGASDAPDYPNGGNLGAHFIPFDLDAEQFSTRPGYRRSDQEAQFKKFNEAVQATWLDDVNYQANPSSYYVPELIDGWYGGPGHPSATYVSGFVPSGWAKDASGNPNPEGIDLWQRVFGKSCVTCHSQRDPARNFSTFAKFKAESDVIQRRVFTEGAMPLSEKGNLNFWLSYPSQPKILAAWLGMKSLSSPGRPVARVNVVFNGAFVTPGAPVVLDATSSQFANSFSWRQLQGPTVALTPLSANNARMGFTAPPGAAAAMIFEVVASLGSQSSAPVDANVVSMTPPGAPLGVTAVAGVASAQVAWTVPASDGLSPITGYTITSSPGAVTATAGAGATNAQVTGLLAGTSYTFTVVAANAAGQGAASAPSNQVTIATTPDAPVLTAVNPGDQSLFVSWTAPANGGNPITGYDVVATPSSGTPFTASGVTGTSTTLSPLTNGVAYTVKVRAVNGAGPGPYSTPSAATTPAGVPGAPAGLSASRGNAQVTLSWTAPATTGGVPLVGYVITASPAAPGQPIRTTATARTVTGLTNGTAYTFSVVADNGTFQSAPAQTAPVTPATVPGQPTITSITPASSAIALVWTAPSSGGDPISSYTLTATPSSGPPVNATAVGSATSGSITGLTNGASYTATVTATNSVGSGTPSGAAGPVSPSATPGAPSVPQSVSAVANGSTAAFVSWSAPMVTGNSAITGYTVYAFPSSGSAPPPQSAGTSTSFNFLGLTGGLSYTFTVTATNLQGTSPQSAASNSVNVVGPPQDPTGVSAAITAAQQVTVSWTAPVNNGGAALSGYTVRWTPAGGATTNPSTVGATVTQLAVTGLTGGTGYTFTVTANNTYGSSAGASTSATAADVPSAPTLSAVTPGVGSFNVTWTAGNANGSTVSGYTVLWSGGSKAVGGAGATGTTVSTADGLATCTQYALSVRAESNVGSSTTSVASAPKYDALAPATPGVLSVSRGPASAFVSWSAAAPNGCAVTSYDVYQGPPYGIVFSGNTLSNNFTGLTTCAYNYNAGSPTQSCGKQYYFNVRANNVVGTSYWQGPQYVTPQVSFNQDNLNSIIQNHGCTGCHVQGSNPLAFANSSFVDYDAATRYNNISALSQPNCSWSGNPNNTADTCGVIFTSPNVAASHILTCPTNSSYWCQHTMNQALWTTSAAEYTVLNTWVNDGWPY